MKKKNGVGVRIPELFLLCCALGTALCSSCNERITGCLDIQAQNFDFDAEENDPSSCVYPDLILNVFYRWDTASLQTQHLYANTSGQIFAIHGVQVLLSGFVVRDMEGNDLTIEKQVTITKGTCDNGTEMVVPDDFIFVDRTAVNYALGGFRESGTMVQFTATVGVPEAYTPLCLERLSPGHPLRAARAGYDPVTGDHAMGRFIISRDSVSAVRDTFFAYGTPGAVVFDVMRTFHRGGKDTLYLDIDFARIMDPVDWNHPDSVVSATLASGIPGAMVMR